MTTVNLTQSESAVALAPAHARFSRRIQAASIDVLVHGASLIALMCLLELLRGHRPMTGAAVVAWLGFALLYEPVLVSRRGATLGHALSHLRVVDLETGSPPDPASAFARFWLKATSGVITFAVMALTGRPHALHDLAVGTFVRETEQAAATASRRSDSGWTHSGRRTGAAGSTSAGSATSAVPAAPRRRA